MELAGLVADGVGVFGGRHDSSSRLMIAGVVVGYTGKLRFVFGGGKR